MITEQNSRVKIALDALGRMMRHHEEWVEIAKRYRFVPGVKKKLTGKPSVARRWVWFFTTGYLTEGRYD